MSLTPAQIKLQGIHWGRVAKKHRWTMAGGRLASDASQDNKEVWARATELALREHRGITARDLRHACYSVASRGRTAAIKEMSNGEFSQLLALFNLLMDDTNVPAALDLVDPSREQRRRLIWSIERTSPGDAYTESISKAVYKTDDWQSLPIEQLQKLNRMIWARQKTQNKPVNADDPY